MRHLLLALLIALLPIRGWVGNAMALTMTSQGAAVQVMDEGSHRLDRLEHSVAVHAAVHAPMDGQADTGHGAHHPDPHTDSHTPNDDEPAHAHGSCDVCNGPAMALGWPASAALPQPQVLASTPAVRFASTVLPQRVKPPIS